jgi:hypothetical protein
MNYILESYQKIGFKINWSSLLIGLIGFEEMYGKISAKEIIDYVTLKISENPNVEDDDIWELIGLTFSEKERLIEILNKLSKKEKSNIETEKRKIIVILLKNIIETKNDNYLDGIINLIEFWSSFNFPVNSPFIVQGKNNDIKPEEYYSEKNYNKMLNNHYKWIEKEIIELKK